jgi:predicted MFS family arabinose efflux permease
VASAVGLNSASFNGARIVGPAIAGLLIARVGLAPGFLLNALAFAIASATLLQVPARPPRSRLDTGTFAGELAEGFAYAARTPVVRLILALQLVVSFCVFNFTVYVPLLARQVLGLGSEGFGLLMAAMGIGAVLAGLSLGALGSRPPPPGAIAVALGCACALLLGVALVRRVWPAAVLLALIGFAGTLVMAGCNTVIQLSTPDALRGRMMSLYTLSSGVFPLGAFWVGFASQLWGVSTTFAINGTLGLLALAALRPWRGRRGRRG